MKKLVIFIASTLCIPAMALINGAPVAKAPDLVRLVFKNNSHVCTGVFVDEYTILTAAHCISKSWDSQSLELDRVLSTDDIALEVEQLENIPHPEYQKHSWWPAHDIGIIKTTKNPRFAGGFQIRRQDLRLVGSATLFGCGVTDIKTKLRDRHFGQNEFYRIGSLLFFFGSSKSDRPISRNASVAANDSGGPIVNDESKDIIAIATQTTAESSTRYGLPILSVGTTVTTKSNMAFVISHMGPSNPK